ncbi:hypothetical protein SP695_004638 [Salmonella enterica]|nr:hypothetical protein [Salmonella enterica]
MSIRRNRIPPELKKLVQVEYETSNRTTRDIAEEFGLSRRTVTEWAIDNGWRRNYIEQLPSTGHSLAVIEHLKLNPDASATELTLVSHDDISQRRIQLEERVEHTARTIHALLQNEGLRKRDGLTVVALAAASKALADVERIQRRALGMKDGVCYRLRMGEQD